MTGRNGGGYLSMLVPLSTNSSFRRALVRFSVDSEWGRVVFSFDFTDSLHRDALPSLLRFAQLQLREEGKKERHWKAT